jgi:hypothetical protein
MLLPKPEDVVERRYEMEAMPAGNSKRSACPEMPKLMERSQGDEKWDRRRDDDRRKRPVGIPNADAALDEKTFSWWKRCRGKKEKTKQRDKNWAKLARLGWEDQGHAGQYLD